MPASDLSSANFSIPRLVENQGSGFRVGATYQLTSDVLSSQPVEASTSASYSLQGRPLVTVSSAFPSCGVYVNDDAELTDTISVDLSLICGHPSGCAQMQFSNNGVGWSAPRPFATSAPWDLVANDGNRRVFVRFQNGLGNWSGTCFDAIQLDTTAPSVTISPTGGTYMSPQQIAVTASEPGTIWYTTDGSDPKTSPTSLQYTGPVTLSSNGTLKAFSVDRAGFESAVVSETYEICGGSHLGIAGTVVDATRDNAPMPLVVITLSSGHSTSTSPTGQYSFTGLPRGWYTIESVTAPVAGYVTYQEDFKLCEASIDHQIVLTRDGTVYGTDTNSGFSSEGVNTSTGNYALKVMDLALPGVGPSFVFERTYNSQDATDGPLGYGWTWSFNVELTEFPDGEMVMRWGDGKTEVWNPDGMGGWAPMYGVFSTLLENPDGTFTQKGKDLVEYHFDASNRLAAVVDEYGNTMSFQYSGSDLGTVVDTAGRTITFSHDASGRITNVLDPIGRSASFSYDANGNLASATDLAGETTRFTYDDSHRLLTITDPKGNVVLTNTYDTGRSAVISQRDALGDETRYLYDVPNRTTTILDAEGNTTTHVFDERLRLVEASDARGFSSTRTYDARGNLTSVTDKNGNVTTYAHDDRGNVLTKTEPLGRVTTATYDAENNPLTKTDARGSSTVFDYDPANGNLLASHACGDVPIPDCATDPGVLRTTYTYNPATGQLLSVTEAAGHPTLERTTTYQYDAQGNNVAVIDAFGNTSHYFYDAVGRKVSESHPLGRAVAYEYDEMDRLLAVIDGLGGVAQYVYDVNGNKTEHWDVNGKRTTFVYDKKNRLVRRTDALGNDEEYCYDGTDRRTSVTNARGATAWISYDPVGNVQSEIDPLGFTVTYEYDANGNRISATNARGATKELEYNELNLLVAVTDPLGNTSTYQYDLEGNQTHATDALGRTTVSVYDAFHRVESVTDPLGNSVTNSYDLLGRLESVTDARGKTTTYTYDALDRLVGVIDAAGGTVGSSYDALGNRLTVTDPRGKVSTFEYDELNRLVSATDPLGNSVLRSYDAVGNLLALTNADGTTTYQYDDLYRVTEITQPDLTTVTYTYDEVGNRTGVSDPAGVTSFVYDLGDRVTEVTDPFGNTVGYTYDPNGNRSSIRYPGFRIVSYLYDALDRVEQVQDWGGVTTTYTYDEAGRLAQEVMGNGAVVSYGYDDAGRLVRKTDRAPGGEVIVDYEFTLDSNGNRIGLDVTQPLLPDVGVSDQVMAHNDGNQIVTNDFWIYGYDGRGNRVSATDGVTSIAYTYDFNNRLTSVAKETDLWQYVYTSNGHRIASKENGVETRWLLDLIGPLESALATMDGGNSIKILFVYGGGLLYSVNAETGERHFYHYDPLGNAVATADVSGAVISSTSYTPYGITFGGAQTSSPRFDFGGKFGVTHESNGLYFMRARFYDPETKTFLGKDPVPGSPTDPQSLNPYSFVQGNPMLWSDPTGRVRWGDFWWGAAKTTLGVVGMATSVAAVSTGLAAPLGVTLGILSAAMAMEGAAEIGGALAEQREPQVGDPFKYVAGVAATLGGHDAGQAMTTVAAAELAVSIGVGGIAYATGPGATAGLGGLAEYVGGVVFDTADFLRSGHDSENTGGSSNHAVNSPPSGGTGSSPPAVETKAAAIGAYLEENRGPETARLRRMIRLRGGKEAFVRWMERVAQPPSKTRSLSVSGYARGRFNETYRYILAEDFLDQRTLSYVEARVANEIAALSQKKYRYNPDSARSKRRAKERRAADVSRSIDTLYSQLVSALSKHQVVVRELSAMPAGETTGGIAMTGVYAGGGG